MALAGPRVSARSMLASTGKRCALWHSLFVLWGSSKFVARDLASPTADRRLPHAAVRSTPRAQDIRSPNLRAARMFWASSLSSRKAAIPRSLHECAAKSFSSSIPTTRFSTLRRQNPKRLLQPPSCVQTFATGMLPGWRYGQGLRSRIEG